MEVVVGSYVYELIGITVAETRQIIESPIYKKLYQHHLSADSSSNTRFHLSNESSYYSVGVGGSFDREVVQSWDY